VAASLGDLTEAAIHFEYCLDVSYGGVLFALPALLFNGLLYKNDDYFKFPAGYYGLRSVFIILAFLVLLRVKSLEGVRYMPPGELGKLVGLDRIPEVKTLREKVDILTESGNVGTWHEDLSHYWMESHHDLSGYLYVDGHVRVYHGKQTNLPRRYVSRERLCLRGMTDFWVNDALGQPFFVVPTALNRGLIAMLQEEIIPRLLQDVPNQPPEETLAKDLYLHRFVMVFDREGYSPNFFEYLFLTHRIACITYKKYPGEDWPEEEFEKKEAVFKNGEKVTMWLAERPFIHSEVFGMREIRKLNENGHQTAILTTDFKSKREEVAIAMFQRWSQENFFKYMLEHFGIDRMAGYGLEPIPGTTRVMNPEYRTIENLIKKGNGKVTRLKVKFGSYSLREIDEPKVVDSSTTRMAEIVELITLEKDNIMKLKEKRRKIPKYITFDQLLEKDRFSSLGINKKKFLDTIKMVAYRAETALANIIRPYMARKDEARSIVRQIFETEANLIPDKENKQLVVELHNLTNDYSDGLVRLICEENNNAEITFPGTEMKIIYKMVSENNRRCQ